MFNVINSIMLWYMMMLILFVVILPVHIASQVTLYLGHQVTPC